MRISRTLVICAVATASPWTARADEEALRTTGASSAAIDETRRTHVEANVPGTAEFEAILLRDLARYFATDEARRGQPVAYELLRDGPTQSGVAYPKYYLWVRVGTGATPYDRGAVRVAAIERRRFEVTHFISEESIRRDPEGLEHVFPAAVCERIREKVRE